MPTGLLLGAGFSYDLGMPLAGEFTKPLFNYLNNERMKSMIDGMKEVFPYGEDNPLDKAIFNDFLEIYRDFMENDIENYEELFKRIEDLKFLGREKSRSRDYFLRKIDDIINESFLIFQKSSYIYYLVNRDLYVTFLKKLIEQDLWVFTLNHDICLEMLCIDYDIPFTYGTDSKISFPISNLKMSSEISFDLLDATVTNIDYLNFNNSADKIKNHKTSWWP